MHLDGDASCVVTDSAFVHNTALEGGGVYATGQARPELVNCTLQNNSAALVGGAVLVDETAAVTLRQCAVFFNRAARGGGAIASLAPDPVLFRGSHQRLAVWASGAWSM